MSLRSDRNFGGEHWEKETSVSAVAEGLADLLDDLSLELETTLNKVQKSSLLLTYEINAVGPILVIKNSKSNFNSAMNCLVSICGIPVFFGWFVTVMEEKLSALGSSGILADRPYISDSAARASLMDS
ncbi:oxidoreductase [Canna indica]|uniref:Oxidoreductase n=1 Tax=Canna indica TaxID=4628 RepID=A0AAQ3QEG8_9LILI|nr:oxidoreductase [Canna indica]